MDVSTTLTKEPGQKRKAFSQAIWIIIEKHFENDMLSDIIKHRD